MGNTASYHGTSRAGADGVVAGSQEARTTVIGSLFSSCVGSGKVKAAALNQRLEGSARGSVPRLADGSKLERRLASKFTVPTGLYAQELWDERKVRRLILRFRLAPRFPGAELPVRVVVKDGTKCVALEGKGTCPDYVYQEHVSALEECPICFLYYPCLNTTRCCQRGICTECFLQLRPQRFVARMPASSCPFCKHEFTEVVFRGARPEKEIDELLQEECRVKEAMEQARSRQEAEAKERSLRIKKMRIEKCISTLKAVVAAATRERVALWLGFGGEARAKENVLRGDSDWRASLAEPTDDLHELMNISLARRKAYLSIRRSRSSPTLRMTTDTLHVSETCGLHILHDDHHSWNSDKSALDTHRDTVAIEEEPSRAKMYQSAEFGGHQEAPRDLRKAEFDRQPPAQDLTNAAGECEAVTPLEENLIDFESSFAPSSLSSGSWLRVPDDPQRILCDRDPLSPKRRRSARCASVTSSAELLLTVNFMRPETPATQNDETNQVNDHVQGSELPASAFLRRRPGSRREFYSAWELEELALLRDMEARGLLDWVDEADITYEELLLIEAIRRSLLSNP